MWIFEGILYVILLLVFIRYDRKKRLWIKTVSQEEKFEHYLSELSATYGKQKNIEEAEKSAVSERRNTRKSPALQVENAWFYRAGCSFRPSGLLPAGCEVLGGPGFRGAVRLLLWQLWNVDNSAPVRGNDWNLWTYPMAVSAG